MRSKPVLFISLFISIILLSACGPSSAPADERLQVTVSIIPQKYFVDRIAGDLVNVNVMVGPGESPHTYEPQPSQMEKLAKSSLYFSMGVEYEEVWLPKFQEINPDLKIIDTSEGITKIALDFFGDEDHDKEEEHDHETGDLDPHVWLSPRNAIEIALSILNSLLGLDPENAEIYQQNFDVLIEDIQKVDEDIQSALSDIKQDQFITFHPSWGYFASDYGLEQISIEVGGNEPSAAELADLIDFAQQNQIQIIFAEPEFSTRSAETIAAEIDGEVILVSPLAEDWLSNIQYVANSIAKAVR